MAKATRKKRVDKSFCLEATTCYYCWKTENNKVHGRTFQHQRSLQPTFIALPELIFNTPRNPTKGLLSQKKIVGYPHAWVVKD
ncbi:hypothetical protein AXF42_Ash013397 [Apostasia shenzhenica]|uniref:Uncharacterized protein n=1 Tax=Apostasia shenzhenica TaxID=1088818 RepID=A0A2I0A433_9ASPA|nr:hypothetical protein AXF42_Ash013397 [Apostasia shenzhenica]